MLPTVSNPNDAQIGDQNQKNLPMQRKNSGVIAESLQRSVYSLPLPANWMGQPSKASDWDPELEVWCSPVLNHDARPTKYDI